MSDAKYDWMIEQGYIDANNDGYFSNEEYSAGIGNAYTGANQSYTQSEADRRAAALAEEQRLAELEAQRQAQAEYQARNQHAISLGADADNSGDVTDSEWQQYQNSLNAPTLNAPTLTDPTNAPVANTPSQYGFRPGDNKALTQDDYTRISRDGGDANQDGSISADEWVSWMINKGPDPGFEDAYNAKLQAAYDSGLLSESVAEWNDYQQGELDKALQDLRDLGYEINEDLMDLPLDELLGQVREVTVDGNYLPPWLSGPDGPDEDDGFLDDPNEGNYNDGGMVLDAATIAGIIPGTIDARVSIGEAIDQGLIDPSTLPPEFLETVNATYGTDATIGDIFDDLGVEYEQPTDTPTDIHPVIQDLMDSGKTYWEAVAHNESALSQREGVDADGDGYVTDEEWAASTPAGDAVDTTGDATGDAVDQAGDGVSDIEIPPFIQGLMDQRGLTYEEAVAHNDAALGQREGVDADGDGYVTDEEWASWEDPAVVDDTEPYADDQYMVDIGNGTMVDIRDVFNPDNGDWNWYEDDTGAYVFGPAIEGQDPVDPITGEPAGGDGVAGDGQSTDGSGNPVSAPGGTEIEESENGTVSVTTSTGANDGGFPDWVKGIPLLGDILGGNDDDNNDEPGGDGMPEWLDNIFEGLGGGKNILNQAIQFKASDAMGDAYGDASAAALQWQKDMQAKQEPFRNYGQNMLAGLANNTNRWIPMDERETLLGLDTSASGMQADPRENLADLSGGLDYMTHPGTFNADDRGQTERKAATPLHQLDTTPNVRGTIGGSAADPAAFGGYEGLTDFAGQGGNWGNLAGTPAATSQQPASAPSGPTLTDPTNTPVNDGPQQEQQSWQDLIKQDYLRAAANERKGKGKLGTRGDAPIQGTEDALFKAYTRSMGEIEGVKGQQLQQEMARRSYDRDTAMGQRQQQVGEQGSAAQMRFNQLSQNRDRAFNEMFTEDQSRFDRRLSANQERSDWRNQYFGESMALDDVRFQRGQQERQQQMSDRGQIWGERSDVDDSTFRRSQAQNQQQMAAREQYFKELASQNEAQYGRSMSANQQQMADRDQYFRELMAQDNQMWTQSFESARLGQNAASGMAAGATNAADILGARGAGQAAAYGNQYDALSGLFGGNEPPAWFKTWQAGQS